MVDAVFRFSDEGDRKQQRIHISQLNSAFNRLRNSETRKLKIPLCTRPRRRRRRFMAALALINKNQKGNINHFKKQNVAIMQARETEAALATTTYSGTVEHTGQSSAGVGRGVQTVLPYQKIISPICSNPMGRECARTH